MNTTTSKVQPALVGGLVMGVLSALPIVAVGNVCCCLWVVSGGVVAAYVLQQNDRAAITPGDGAVAGVMAGVIGAFVYLVLSIPINLVMAPMQRALLERLIEGGNVPPEFRDAMSSYVGGIAGVILGFFTTLFAGLIFSTLGGFIGALIFRKPMPPAIDIPGN